MDMTLISDDMVEAGARELCRHAWERMFRGKDLGAYIDIHWRDHANGMRAALTAALQGSVVVSQAEWDNLRSILGKLDDQICATKDILTAAKMASQVPRHDGKAGA
jgi:hypothetical protein